MNKRIRKAIALVLAGGGLFTAPMMADAITKTGVISHVGTTLATGTGSKGVPFYAWDGNNSSRTTPNVFNGTSRNLGWAHNTLWYDVNITKAGNYTIGLTRANTAHTGFHPAFSLWAVGANIFDFDACIGHCGDATGRGSHSYNQVAAPSPTNASAWMLGPTGPSAHPDGQTMKGTLQWTPKVNTGAVTGFIGYANSGSGGWTNGVPRNTDGGVNGSPDTFPNFNISVDGDPVLRGGLVNTGEGQGLGGTTLAPASNVNVGDGSATMNLYSLAAGHYLIAIGGSCHEANCGAGRGDYSLEITEIAGEGPQASAKANSPVRALSLVTLDGSASNDPDGDKLAYAWKQKDTDSPQVRLSDSAAAQPTFTAPAEAIGKTLNFTLTVSDPIGGSAKADVAVAITSDNNPPTVNITARPVLEDAQVTLTSTASDPDGDKIASYLWTQTGGTPVALSKVDGSSLSFTAPTVGTGTADLAFSLTVADDYAPNPNSATATASLSINNDPNKLDCSTATASPGTLDKPNKGMKPVRIAGVTGPNSTIALKITGIDSDEPVKSKAGKDSTGPDAKIMRGKATKKNPVAVDSVLLRAERQTKAGPANGRVYTVKFSADDGSQTCEGSVQVRVPVSPGGVAVDDGQGFDALKKK